MGAEFTVDTLEDSSWTFFFHEPYKCDWKEAKSKALGKKWKGIL